MSTVAVAGPRVFLSPMPLVVPAGITMGLPSDARVHSNGGAGASALVISQRDSCQSWTPSVPLLLGSVIAVAPEPASTVSIGRGATTVPPVPADVRRRMWSGRILMELLAGFWLSLIRRLRTMFDDPAMIWTRCELIVPTDSPAIDPV